MAKKNRSKKPVEDASAPKAAAAPTPLPSGADPDLMRRHLKIGWWSLCVFLSLGIVLEVLHGFKVGWYLDVATKRDRFMFTLAHAHGVLLSLVHIGLATTIRLVPDWAPGPRLLASRGLTAAAILMPAGFFLGGVSFYGGDPGLGIFLVPVGALALFVAVFLTARGVGGP